MIRQKCGQLLPDINAVGCYFLNLLTWNEFRANKDFTHEEANNLWAKSMKQGWINNNKNSDEYRCLVDPDRILNEARTIIGAGNGVWAQIGAMENGILEYWRWVTPAWKNAKIYYAAREDNPATGSTHWVTVQSIENPVILYDSWNLARIGEMSTSKRFVLYAYKE